MTGRATINTINRSAKSSIKVVNSWLGNAAYEVILVVRAF